MANPFELLILKSEARKVLDKVTPMTCSEKPKKLSKSYIYIPISNSALDKKFLLILKSRKWIKRVLIFFKQILNSFN